MQDLDLLQLQLLSSACSDFCNQNHVPVTASCHMLTASNNTRTDPMTAYTHVYINLTVYLTKCKHNLLFQGYLNEKSAPLRCGANFYRAMLCIRGTSHGPVSMSVTSRCSTKMAKCRITQTTPHDTPGTLVFCCQRSPRNSTGVTPYEGWSKSAIFDK